MGQILPLVVLAMFTAIATAPWVASGGIAFSVTASLLPAVAIHYWALRRASAFPEIAILFSGLCVDIVSGGVLGLWPSIYALAWVLGLLQRRWAETLWKPGRWLLFSVSMIALLAFVFAFGLLSGRPLAPARELLQAGLWLIAAYPMLAVVLRFADGRRAGRPMELT